MKKKLDSPIEHSFEILESSSKKERKEEYLSNINEFNKNFKESDLKGYSVYDAFNSPFLKFIGKLDIKIINVVITQLFKRIPFNIRSFFGVKKSINPKALGLLLKAELLNNKSNQELSIILDQIRSLKNKEFKNLCWGYNWDYYTLRGGTFPKDYPNAIVTYFIGDALIDYYEKYPSDELKEELLSIRKYFLEDINRTYRGATFCFSYSSADHKEIYNASALISRYLIRLGKVIGTDDVEIVKQAIKYLFDNQNEDGSWYYGYAKNQKWIDSFHTEYMLELLEVIEIGVIEELHLEEAITKARNYYLDNFYYNNVCNYYPGNEYPVNVHSIANRIIYLSKNDNLKEAKEVIEWSFDNLYNNKKHFFYFEKNKWFTNRNNYHRWNQSWMYLSLSYYLKFYNENQKSTS